LWKKFINIFSVKKWSSHPFPLFIAQIKNGIILTKIEWITFINGIDLFLLSIEALSFPRLVRN
jgi:hypothetical protein